MERTQWLEERRKGIGGSDVAAIMGMSPWKTAFSVYQEKRREVEDWGGNSLTDWGKRMEPAIRQWYSDQTGREVRLPDKIMYHPDYPFMFASLDGLTDDRRIVEIKTARSGKKWGEPGTNQIPDYYMLQCQHYMLVTGFAVTDVPVSIAGSPPVMYEVPADKDLQDLIVEAETEFWACVENGTPPAPVTYADAVARFGRIKAEGVVLASQEELDACAALLAVRYAKDELAAKEDELKGKIIISLGEHGDTLVNAEGNALVTYKMTAGRKMFDAKSFEKENPDVYQKYIKVSEPQRRFLLK